MADKVFSTKQPAWFFFPPDFHHSRGFHSGETQSTVETLAKCTLTLTFPNIVFSLSGVSSFLNLLHNIYIILALLYILNIW